MKVLVIEDDGLLSQSICESLESDFQCDTAFDGEEGLFHAQRNIYDVIVLDLMLPLMDGYEVLHKMREQGVVTPVLILTAKDSIDNKVRGFKEGADDYLVKPFHRQELLVRLQSLIRRNGQGFEENTLVFKGLVLNIKNRTAAIEGTALDLRGKQFDILEYLVKNKKIILTKEQIFDRIWGFESDTTANVVEVYTSTVRKELKKFGYDQFLKTVHGVGYMLDEGGPNA